MRPSSPGRGLVVGLLLAAACGGRDKGANPATTILPEGAPALDLSSKPQIIFQVFGERGDPRLMPLAAVVGGQIRPIGLTKAGWRQFDSLYLSAGNKYPIYVDDAEQGSVTVTRGMWTGGDEPLYPLKGCANLRPLAGVTVDLQKETSDPTVELVASSAPLAKHPPFNEKLMTSTDIAALGRRLGHSVGSQKGMDAGELDSLDFTARMLVTGATKTTTLMVSFIDPQGGDLGPGQGHTSNVLALADKPDTGYVATYKHVASGDAKTVEFQRVVDHLDADGDGVDEIFVEAWHYGGTTELVVLNFKNGTWHEALRTSQNWCLDPQPKKK